MTRQARQLSWTVAERPQPLRSLIRDQQHLERVLQWFIDHYNRHRPHRALSFTPPTARLATATPPASGDARIVRRDCLGGVVHEYVRAA